MSGYAMAGRDRFQRFWEQLSVIADRLGTELAVEPRAAAPGSGVAPRYVYQAGKLYCRDEAAERLVRDRLGSRCGAADGSGCPADGRLLAVADVHPPTEVDRLNQLAGEPESGRPGRPAISLNHLVSVAINPVTICPADEPKPVPPPRTGPWPPPAEHGGAGVHVLVVDTGLPVDHPWAGDPTVDVPDQQWQPLHQDGSGLIRQYAGHGTFVTGVLKAAAPEAKVTMSGALVNGGAQLEASLGAELLAVLSELDPWPDIISLSAGGTSQHGRDLLGLEPLLDRLAEHPGTLLVAAAGNDGSRDNPFYPAARAADHPGVISVGALRRDGLGRACFSNYGPTVTVFAPGEHHVNQFPAGLYAYQHPRETGCRYHRPALYRDCPCLGDPDYGTVVSFAGWARWSGTSYATPLVAGMIARHMSDHDHRMAARAAARELLAQAGERVTDVDGEVLPVLRPAGLG